MRKRWNMELKFNVSSIYQTEIHFALNTDFDGGGNKAFEISYGISITYETTDKLVKVIVSLISDKKPQLFVFNISMVGKFNFNKLPKKDVLERIVNINCASIIFPYLRESLADLTRRASIPPFHMDPVNFIQLYENKIKKPSGAITQKQRSLKKRG